ncbi:DUF7282 domain-containing protein [Halopiger xanaduensis]|uniref:Uncharacterized protein n=1 Tax=Halopiger xanaduensis (strain DSM 18323 / JCM 14033 / SH-6) TaxID=797210 RepID=F8D8X8_HALXS|nr:CARDB domain-containing protein [Halopiger xanaduensis]AEH37028.1 hypothetical protein Halxa_2409 [Halopiger xanaduensis SH-6]
MSRTRVGLIAVALVVGAVLVGAVALPSLGVGLGPFDGSGIGSADDGTDLEDGTQAQFQDDDPSDEGSTDESTETASAGNDGESDVLALGAPVAMQPQEGDEAESDEAASSSADATAQQTETGTQEDEDPVEAGVEDGIELAQSQGVEVTQEQRAAAVDGARQAAAQHQSAEAEQVQAATAGAVHGSLMQEQSVNATQIQYAVGGATDGALAQHQTVNASQLQSATWGATHGALAQQQRVTVEQIQVATYGAAAGAASEAGDKGVDSKPKIQEAAQGAAYGVLEQYQKVTVEQRQQVTLEHVQHAAAGASAGALEGSTRSVLEAEREQTIEVEQRQRVDIKQVQKAATGAAKGALEQRQSVSVEQTQAAARGAGKGPLKQVQSVSVEQVQHISITQIQEAAFGASKGAIEQSQEASVEQIQAAADGASQGSLLQRQEVSIAQIQHAATGASKGAVQSAVQHQVVEVEQIQAAARGAGEGAVTQKQIVDVTQVQTLAQGASSGALSQSQGASVEQIQTAARSACEETARVVQSQRISVTQLQTLTQETAADATQYAVTEGITDATQIVQYVEVTVVQKIEQVDELEGTASIEFPDQESDGASVVVDSVELSEGGFVAIYEGVAVDTDPDAVVGTSAYLEAGEHEDLEIALDEQLNESQALVAVVHHDTNDDGSFDYVDSDGAEDEPYVTAGGGPVLDGAFVTVADDTDREATLNVTDQTGDGETLVVDEANASVDYAVTAEYDGERVDSESFDAGQSVENLELDLEPLLEENATVNVSVRALEDDAELANESIAYTVATEPSEPEPEATLNVSDQEGDGETLLVDDANASVEYVVSAEYDGERVDSEPFAAGEAAENESIALEPPLENDTTVDVSVRDAATDEALANDSVAYAVADEGPEPGPEPEPEATLDVGDQTGSGEALVVDEANASVDYALAVTDEDGEQRAASDAFAAGETVENESLALEPPLEANATLEVAVVAADGDNATADGNGTAAPLANETIEYTVDESPAFGVEFVDCSRAEVTGSFEDGDTVIVATSFYESGGFGNSMGEYALSVGENIEGPVEGTVVFETGEDFAVSETEDGAYVEVPQGQFGSAITGIVSPDATPGSIDYPNPDASECLEQVRPEQPEIGVKETTPTDDGEAVEVTFGYENPNDAPLFVDSAFVEGTTDDEPPEELESGTGEFTVEWTPESDDEQLVWEVDLSRYDYEEALTAETATAGEIAPTEPAAYEVSIADTNAPVEQGESLTINADVENVGGEAAEQPVTLAVAGTETDSVSVGLDPGESETVTLNAETAELEPGEYPITVSSENDTVETSVTIEAAAESDAGDAGAAGAGANDSPEAPPEDGTDTQSPQGPPETPDESPNSGATDDTADSGTEPADEPTGPGPSPEPNGSADAADQSGDSQPPAEPTAGEPGITVV